MLGEISWAARRIIANPTRRSVLAAGGLAAGFDLFQFLRSVIPRARESLARIRDIAEKIPDEALRCEALASIDAKAFHVAGGCIFATFLPKAAAERYIAVVAPLETIYDYLDNLCDRHPNASPAAYARLHRALADALDPFAGVATYYDLGPDGDDGGYLAALVSQTQRALRTLDGYETLLPFFREAARLYGERQTLSHLSPGERERACIAFYERERAHAGDLEWHEFACAAGSNMHVFAPLFMLFDGNGASTKATHDAYFPAMSAVHILLDSFIDQAEDRAHGDLSFVAVYRNAQSMHERLGRLSEEAAEAFSKLPNPQRHRFVLRTMALFYLTHPKVYAQHLDAEAQELLCAIGDALAENGTR